MPRLEGETYFNNFLQTGYDELRSWTPRYYQGIREADANMQFAGSTIDLMADSLEKFCKNLFAKTMDEEELARMEKYFYIEKNSKLDISERRRLLAIAMAGSGKISTTKIADLIRTYTGAESSFTFLQRLYICIHLGEDYRLGSMEMLKEALGTQMPAHIAYMINYRTELVINEWNLEQVAFDNVRFHMSLPFWYVHEYTLDGSWPLDGSVLLHTRKSYQLILGVKFYQGVFPVTQQFELVEAGITAGVRIKERMDVGMKSYAGIYFGLKEKASLSVQVETQPIMETVGLTVETKNRDRWFLDGTVLLDGSRNLDAIYKVEAVE